MTRQTESGSRIPTVGNDPRDGMEVDEPAGKTWFRDLDEAVIEADRCIRCGTCVAACPSDSIGIDEDQGRPTLVKMCTGCSRCWDNCPRSGLRYERVAHLDANPGEHVKARYAARATADRATQDGENGGAVTALLVGLLEAGAIDGAIVARNTDSFEGEPVLARSKSELIDAAGSVFTQTMQLGRVEKLIERSELTDPSLAIVGTPCVIEGVTALTSHGRPDELASLEYTIALGCTSSFEADRLRSQVASFGVDPETIEEIKVVGNSVTALGPDGETKLSVALDDVWEATLPGCHECADFAGRAADITAATIGSPSGATTLVVRTEAGENALEVAGDRLELETLDNRALASLDQWNRNRAENTIPRELDPTGTLSISYAEHRAAYDGTDRSPEPLNRARVYQYEEWC